MPQACRPTFDIGFMLPIILVRYFSLAHYQNYGLSNRDAAKKRYVHDGHRTPQTPCNASTPFISSPPFVQMTSLGTFDLCRLNGVPGDHFGAMTHRKVIGRLAPSLLTSAKLTAP